MNNHHPSHTGFTLVELILYIGITTIVVVALLNVMISVLGNMEKLSTTSVVQQELRYSLERMTHTVITADTVSTTGSVFNVSGGTLMLYMSGASINPTVFFLSGSQIFAAEGGTQTGAITSPSITVDALRFTNRTATGAFTTVHIELHGSKSGSSPDEKYSDDMTLQTSLTLRQ